MRVLLLCFFIAFSCAPAAASPNVIFILADDMGFGDTDAFIPTSKIHTPSLEELASRGTRLVRDHTPSSVCSPTRYSILTGTFSWRTGGDYAGLASGVVMPWDPPIIKPTRLTIAEMFKAQGYATGMVGKWHLGVTYQTTDGHPITNGANIDFSKPVIGGPSDAGFDESYWVNVPAWPPLVFYDGNYPVHVPDALAPQNLWRADIIPQGPYWTGYKHEDVAKTITEKALDFIDAHSSEPFFLYAALSAPHAPDAPSSACVPADPAKPYVCAPETAGPYGTFVQEDVDGFVGKILAKLDALGIADNTLIVFTSDNGGDGRDGQNYWGQPDSLLNNWGHQQNWPWRGTKSTVYEGGFVVPTIVAWPGQVSSGATIDTYTSQIDWARTFARIIGYTVPSGQFSDSFDMLPLLTGAPVVDVPRPNGDIVMTSKNGTKILIHPGTGSIWKFIAGATAGGGPYQPGYQMFNLDSDLRETTDRYPTNTAHVNFLKGLLNGYVASPMHP